MVFQQPNPFPMSVFDNIAYVLREQGSRRARKKPLEPAVHSALDRAGLFEEVKDNLDHPALKLSGGQQQRLCIARALAAEPEVLLLDEPCSALDPQSTQVIEDLIVKLRDDVAVVIVTHNLQQAYRVADYVGFMYLGDLVEYATAHRDLRLAARAADQGVRERCVRLAPITVGRDGRVCPLAALALARLRDDPGRRGAAQGALRAHARRPQAGRDRQAPLTGSASSMRPWSAATATPRSRSSSRNDGEQPVNDLPICGRREDRRRREALPERWP